MPVENKVGFAKKGSLGRFANWDTSVCTHTCEDAIAEIERESNIRMKCYDRWISEGKMTPEEAELRMGGLVSAWHFLSDSEEGRQMLASKTRKNIPF